jgi:hypothetical protein
MNYPTAIVVSAVLIAGAFALSTKTEANHPHAHSAHIVSHDRGVYHMQGDKVRHCGFEQQGTETSKPMRCGAWQ